jgi:hypothetical protein
MCGVVSEALASGKVVYREVCTEGSQTAKSGTDEQKIRSLLVNGDVIGGIFTRVSKHIFVTPNEYQKGNYVDHAGIGRREKLLPGEICI